MEKAQIIFFAGGFGILTCLVLAAWFLRTGLRQRQDEAWMRRYERLQNSEVGTMARKSSLPPDLLHYFYALMSARMMSVFRLRENADSESFHQAEGVDRLSSPKEDPGVLLILGGVLSGGLLFWLGQLAFQIGEPGSLLWTVILAVSLLSGAFAPRHSIRYLHKRKRDALERVAPDVIDLLVLAVGAGLTLDAGLMEARSHISRYSRKMKEELDLFMAELSVLPTRKEAFDNLVKRTGSETFRYLAVALQQGEKYGTPVPASLKIVTEESRKRAQIALESKAGRLPVWLSLPLMLLVLPPVVAMSAGPGFVSLIRSIGGGA